MSWPNKQLKEEIMKYKNVHISVESNDKKPGLVNKLYQLISMKKIEITSRKEFLERREKRKKMCSEIPGICDFLIRTEIPLDAFYEK